jgi:hypothetical protein
MSTLATKIAEVQVEFKNLRETVQAECDERKHDHDDLLVLKEQCEVLKSQLASRYNNFQQWILILASAAASAALTKMAEKLF